MPRRHEWSSEHWLVLLTNGGYRREMGCISHIIPVRIVVARMARAEEGTYRQEEREGGVQYTY